MFFCFRPKRQRGVAAREGPALIVPGLSIRQDGAPPTTLHILRIPDYDIPECAILVLYRFVRSQRSPTYPPERAELFEPAGWTQNPEIRNAKSIVDYIFRWLGNEFSESYRADHSGSS